MNNRRRFITLVPFAGTALLAACSKETSTTTTTMPAPAPSTAPTPAPAPMAEPAAPMSASTPATGASTPATVGSTNLPLLDPADPAAVGLGYVAVSSQADKAKYPKHTPDQKCAGCSLYAAGPDAPQGPCAVFAGKAVLAGGWCSAWVKRA